MLGTVGADWNGMKSSSPFVIVTTTSLFAAETPLAKTS